MKTTSVQYDENGDIKALVYGSEGRSPECPMSLVLEGWVDTTGKKVDLDTLQLIDIPAYEG